MNTTENDNSNAGIVAYFKNDLYWSESFIFLPHQSPFTFRDSPKIFQSPKSTVLNTAQQQIQSNDAALKT